MWHGQSFYLFFYLFLIPLKKQKGTKQQKHNFEKTKQCLYILTNTNKNTVFIFCLKTTNKITKQCLISLNKQNKQIHSFLSVLINNKYNKQIFHIPWKIKTKNNVIILCKNKTRKQFHNPLEKQNKKTIS